MIALNSALDANALAPAYAVRSRLQIRDILEPEGAEAVLRSLEAETLWGVAFNDGGNVVQIPAERAAQLTPDQQRHLLQQIHERARTGYQFFYNYYPVSKAYIEGAPLPGGLAEIYKLLNSPGLLQFVRTVTGLSQIRWADAHATLYRAGHFLKYHTDENVAEHRLAAYVLNLTKGWGRDWGGYLQFFNERYDIDEGYRPVFNALNLFTVPADHSVSMISSYAPSSRYSVTGWFRGDRPPGQVGIDW